MAAHKYWRVLGLTLPTAASPAPVELSELQLFSGATRLDAAATLTSNIAPTSGTLASLKDDVTTTGPYWADLSNQVLILTWSFPSAVDVDGVLLGARTTIARFPTSGLVQGGESASGTAWPAVLGFGGLKFVSGAKTPVVGLQGVRFSAPANFSLRDFSTEGGRGLITDTVKTKATPANTPAFARVRLVRDIDGKVIRETWSDPVTGVYTFNYFDPAFTYSVIAYHPTGSFRAVIADRITPGLMP